MIIDKLAERIIELKNPAVVGLDPRLKNIPAFLREDMINNYGETPRAAAEAIFEFNRVIIDSVCGVVPAVKPQIAFYELFGADGIGAYQRTVAYAKQKNLIVIGDIKRGDIASTAAAYSDGHIGTVRVGGTRLPVFDEDFITVNPYLGYDAVEPFLENCGRYGKGLFILVKTSNNSSRDIQDLTTPNGTVYEEVARLVGKWGEGLVGECGYSSIGAVVGATFPEQAKKIRAMIPKTFFLVPGYGAQGANAADIAACFDKDGLGAIVNSSRGIISAYADEKYKNDFTEREFGAAAGRACADMADDLREIINY